MFLNKFFFFFFFFFFFSENEDARLPSLSNQSSSQYLICRRTKHTQANESTPILGFGLLQEPCVLIALLHTGDIVVRCVIDLYYFPKIEPPEPVIDKKEKVSNIIANFFKL